MNTYESGEKEISKTKEQKPGIINKQSISDNANSNLATCFSKISNFNKSFSANKKAELELSKNLIEFLITRKLPLIYLEGDPGCGKTYLIKSKMPDIIKKINEIINKDEKPNQKEIDRFKSICENYELDESKINTFSILFFKKLNLKKLNDFLEEFKDIEDVDKQINNFFSILFTYINNQNKDNSNINFKQEIKTHSYVLPSLENPTNIIENPKFRISKEEILSEYKDYPILKALENCFLGEISILLLDELSELIKLDQEKNTKSLHPFLDDYRNKKIVLNINPSKITDKTYNILKNILNSKNKHLLKEEERKKIELVIEQKEKSTKNDEVFNISFDLSELNLTIVATGNIRTENDLSGLLKSTENRFVKINFKKITDLEMHDFLNDFIDSLIFDELNGLEKPFSKFKNFDHEKFIKSIEYLKNKLIGKKENEKISGGLYSKLLKNTENSMSPSIRTMVGLIKNYLSFYSLYLSNFNFDIEGYKLITDDSTGKCELNGIEKEKLNFIGKQSLNPKSYIDFLEELIENSYAMPTTSHNFISETNESIVDDDVLNSILQKNKNIGGIPFSGRFGSFSMNIQGSDLYFSQQYLKYILFSFCSILSNQKFNLLMGQSQEGKSTLFKVQEKLLDDLLKEHNLSFKKIKTKKISKIEEFSLSKSNTKDIHGNDLTQTELISIIKEANENKDFFYLVLVDEIDRKTFTSELNQLLTEDIVNINGDEFKISNIFFISTSNSTTLVDNLVNRAVSLLLFSEVLTNTELSDKLKIQERIITYLYEVLNKKIKEDDRVFTILNSILDSFEERKRSISKIGLIKNNQEIISDSTYSLEYIKEEYEEFKKDQSEPISFDEFLGVFDRTCAEKIFEILGEGN